MAMFLNSRVQGYEPYSGGSVLWFRPCTDVCSTLAFARSIQKNNSRGLHDRVAMFCPWHGRAVFLILNETIQAAFVLRSLHAGSICAQRTRKMI